MTDEEKIISKEEVYEVYKTVSSHPFPFENIQSFNYRKDFNEDAYSEGKHELGEGRWINENEYINLNERCDTHLQIIEHPIIKAISSAHFHRQGFVGSLTIFLK